MVEWLSFVQWLARSSVNLIPFFNLGINNRFAG